MLGSRTTQQIREQMVAVRAAMRQDADELQQQLQECTDYRRQVRLHPWLCCAGASVLGFLVVPRRKRPPVGPTAQEPGPGVQAAASERASLRSLAGVFGRSVAEMAAVALAEKSLEWMKKDAASSDIRAAPPDSAPSDSAPPEAQPATSPDSEEGPVIAMLKSDAAGFARGLEASIADHPKASMVAAVAVGVLLGCLAKRR